MPAAFVICASWIASAPGQSATAPATRPERDGPVAALLTLAERQAGDREFGAAEDSYKRAVALAPDSAPARKALARFYWKIGRFRLAVDAFLALRKVGGELDPESAKWLVQCHLNLDQVEQAEEGIRGHIELHPRDPEGHLLRALVLLSKDRRPETLVKAMASFDEALRLDPNHVLARWHKARLLWLQRKPDDALATLSSVTGDAPKLSILRSRILESQGKLDEAIRVMEAAVKAAPNQHEAARELVALYIRTKATAKLHALAMRRLAAGGDDAFFLGGIDTNALLEDVNASVRILKVAMKRLDYEPLCVGMVLDLLSRARRWQEVVDLAREVRVAIGPLEMGELRRAQIELLCFVRASNALVNGLNDEAKGKELLDRAIEIAAPYRSLRRWLGTIVPEERRYEVSERALREALRKSPDDATLRRALAHLMYRNGRLRESREILERHVRQSPKDRRAWQLLALIYMRQAEHEEARAAFEKVLGLDPDDFTTLNNYAWFLAERNELKRARELARRAWKAAPLEAMVLDTYGWVLLLSRETDEAVKWLRRSTAVEKAASNCYHLAVALNRQNAEANRAEVRTLCREAIELDPKGRSGEYGRPAAALLDGLPPESDRPQSQPASAPRPKPGRR